MPLTNSIETKQRRLWESIRPYRSCFFECAEHYCEFQCEFYCKTTGDDATAHHPASDEVIEWVKDVRHLPVDVVSGMIDFADCLNSL